uniref:Uncharacterized protein n=1 Tax=Nelumbo nucifera TaxID=4432 RepID=A0A822ZG78_NELNU|nr:TPA_asm: hypothetical protein HUJ06_000921 [Nelumbo nucifera]
MKCVLTIIPDAAFKKMSSHAAASLLSLVRDNDRYGKLIIDEGGVVPLLKLAKKANRKVKRMLLGQLRVFLVLTRFAFCIPFGFFLLLN